MEEKPQQNSTSGGIISVKRLEPTKIQPEKQTLHRNNGSVIYPLTNLDQTVTNLMQTVYIFKPDGDGTGDDHLYADVIKKGLARVLVHYYPFCGRLVKINSDDDNEKLAVETNGELGVPFVEAFSDCGIDQIGDIIVPDSQLLGKFVFTVSGVENVLEMPLLTAQVTKFKCGGFVLGLTINHCMSDGLSAMEFVNSWAETSRGKSPLSLPPFLDRSILTLPKNSPSPNKLTIPSEKFGTDLNDVSNLKTLYEHEEMVYQSFNFDFEKLSALKKLAMEENGEMKNCSSFSVLAALVWRNRSRALKMKPYQETKLIFTVDIRSKLNNNNDKKCNNSLVLPKGYFGNAVVTTECVCMAGELTEKPFSYAVKMVQNAIKRVDEDYIRSYINFFDVSRGGKPPSLTATLVITSWSRISFASADFGWGEPIQFGSIWIPKEVALFRSDHGKEKRRNGIVLVLGLPNSAMNVFQELMRV